MNRRSKFLAQVAFYGLGLGLLAYAASRTLAFVQNTMSADRQILGYLYLLATGIGALVWLFVLLTYAEGARQRGIAFAMGVLDLCAELVLVYADTIRVSAENQLLKMTESEMQTFIVASVAAVGLNIAAVYFFKLFDPQAEAASRARDLVDETAETAYKQLNTPESRRAMIDELAPVLRSAIMADVTEQVYSAAGRYVAGDSRALPAPNWPGAQPPAPPKETRTGFFDRIKRRNPFRPAPKPLQLRPMESVHRPEGGVPSGENNQAAWTVDPTTGEAKRIFCLVCRDLGRDWTGPQICEHIDTNSGRPIQIQTNEHQSWPGPGSEPQPSPASAPNVEPPTPAP